MTSEHLRDKKGNLLAIVLYAGKPEGEGVRFFTSPEHILQVGCMVWPKDHRIEPHIHNPQERTTVGTAEVLFVKRGCVVADIYGTETTDVRSRALHGGDVLILLSGAHGFRFERETECWEIKSGPYDANTDKVHIGH